MKRTALIVVLLAACAGAALAQDWDNPQLLAKAGLSEQEIAEVTAVFDDTEKIIQGARLEIDVLRAQLRKLLFAEEQKVEMREVERLLRSSLEWELKERMAQVRRQVELRRILGDRRYAHIIAQLRERLRRERGPDSEAPQAGAPKPRS